ncbi:MAG TPA: hypothetical protein VN821_04235 [Candidatus Udaeobacter sp.]|nr:hypothetical protein [Candidatus Udaeobacter sp.]
MTDEIAGGLVRDLLVALAGWTREFKAPWVRQEIHAQRPKF